MGMISTLYGEKKNREVSKSQDGPSGSSPVAWQQTAAERTAHGLSFPGDLRVHVYTGRDLSLLVRPFSFLQRPPLMPTLQRYSTIGAGRIQKHVQALLCMRLWETGSLKPPWPSTFDSSRYQVTFDIMWHCPRPPDHLPQNLFVQRTVHFSQWLFYKFIGWNFVSENFQWKASVLTWFYTSWEITNSITYLIPNEDVGFKDKEHCKEK